MSCAALCACTWYKNMIHVCVYTHTYIHNSYSIQLDCWERTFSRPRLCKILHEHASHLQLTYEFNQFWQDKGRVGVVWCVQSCLESHEICQMTNIQLKWVHDCCFSVHSHHLETTCFFFCKSIFQMFFHMCSRHTRKICTTNRIKWKCLNVSKKNWWHRCWIC